MDTFTQRTLTQLAKTFTVRDVMVEAVDLVRAQNQSEAQEILQHHTGFDVIPISVNGSIEAYYCRDSSRVKQIRSDDLVSDGTSLLDLPSLLIRRKFFFVLSTNAVCGYIHFADLNKGQMKLPFFVLFEAVERRLWSFITNKPIDIDLRSVLDTERSQALEKRMQRARKKDVDAGWDGLLSFNEIIRFCVYYGILDLEHEERDLLSSIRNRIVHSDKLLVNEHKTILIK